MPLFSLLPQQCRGRQWRINRPFFNLFLAGLVWVASLIYQHVRLVQQQGEMATGNARLPSQLQAYGRKTPGKKAHPSPSAVANSTDAISRYSTLNGVPLTYHAGRPSDAAYHCIHDQGMPVNTSWWYRSCSYTNLCLDMDTREYVWLGDDERLAPPPLALGGINPRWQGSGFNKGVSKVRWAPTPRKQEDISGYYALPVDHVLIPFHSFAAHNVGHLLWDDFYPIYSLLRLFGLLPPANYSLFPMRHQLTTGPLYANCDIRRNKREGCKHNLDKFLPLLGVASSQFSTTKAAVLQIGSDDQSHSSLDKPTYVCATTAVAGLGMLTDHGWEDHGWYGQGHRPHNLGRGPNFQAFSDFLVRHVLGDVPSPPPATNGVTVVVSKESSRDEDRRLDFALQLRFLRQSFRRTAIVTEDHFLWQYTMEEQVQLARRTRIFVTTCGGGAIQATFLPAGSTLVVYYNPEGGFDFANSELTGEPARLDWDLLNNAGHLRVHWLPTTTMNQEADLQLLVALIQHEAAVLQQPS
jgi:hypothetical protein